MAPLHTPHGYWLEEAGPLDPPPREPLRGDHRADVVVVGGGYCGMWAAWHLLERAPDGLRVALVEADLCGNGPSGRNGGFARGWWDGLPELRRRHGDAGALAAAQAVDGSVTAIGKWCRAVGADAWYREVDCLQVAAAPAQEETWEEELRACAELGVPDEVLTLTAAEVRARCNSPVFGAGTCSRAATVQPARLARALRAELIARGVAVHERTPALGLRRDGPGVTAETPAGRVLAGRVVLAVNGATDRMPWLHRRVGVASSHMVITEPVPDVLGEIGWTGGEAITDRRTFLHYFRTTPDGRIAFGWAGGRIGYDACTGGRMELDPVAIARTRAALERFFPGVADREITHAWGGPIDVSPTHTPFIDTVAGGRVHCAAGFTGNGVAASHLAGRALAALALDDRYDDVTRLPIVEPKPVRLPPEPLRWAGGAMVRAAYLRRERIEEDGGRADPLTRAVTGIPRRLGIHLGR